MILADSSVWIDHIRSPLAALDSALDERLLFCHPIVIGEVACGNLRDRFILSAMFDLPQAIVAEHVEVFHLIEQRRWMGRGAGFMDLHLLSSAILSDLKLWTRDKRLAELAAELGLLYEHNPLH
jgi:predicted nucleic acid-binding protein